MYKKYLAIILSSSILFYATALLAWNKQAPSSNILIFVSFSMPKDSLRGWLREANAIKAPVIVCGLLHNSFRDTTKAVMELVSDKFGGIQLDPLLFKRFHIEKVPAVVVTRADCLTQEACNDFNVIYGNVTLEYALKEIANQNDQFSTFALTALQRLKKK